MKYEFKLAVIVKTRSVDTGNLFQVRIVPDMADIAETDLLPYFPNFFGEKDIAYQIDDTVWVITDERFHGGFILGLSQPRYGSDISGFIQTINEAEVNAYGSTTPISGYDELTILQIAGTTITFFNESKGHSGTIYNNKTVNLYGSDGSIWVNNPGYNMSISPDGEMREQGKTKGETWQEVTINSSSSNEKIHDKRIEAAGMITLNAGGSQQIITGGNLSEHTIGNVDKLTAGKKHEQIGQGENKTIVLGDSDTEITAGNQTTTVVLGNITLTALVGSIAIFSGASLSISSTTSVAISAPEINITAGVVMTIANSTGLITIDSPLPVAIPSTVVPPTP